MKSASNTVTHLRTPLRDGDLQPLRVGDRVLLSGVVYTARDAAHKRMVEAINDGKELPFSIEGQAIYYVGPAPARPGQVIGPAGPTTASRVDLYTPLLIERGLKGMIGKGYRDSLVREALIAHKAVYFVAVGGAAALISDRILNAEVVAYHDLGTEAVRKLAIKEFSLTVANDVHGGDLFENGREQYRCEGKT